MMAEFLARLKTDHPELCSIDEADLRFIPGLPPTRIVEVARLLNSRWSVHGCKTYCTISTLISCHKPVI